MSRRYEFRYLVDCEASDPSNGIIVYTGEEKLAEKSEDTGKRVILNNNGYYCGEDSSMTMTHPDYSFTVSSEHITSNICKQIDGDIPFCFKSDRGDPCKQGGYMDCP